MTPPATAAATAAAATPAAATPAAAADRRPDTVGATSRAAGDCRPSARPDILDREAIMVSRPAAPASRRRRHQHAVPAAHGLAPAPPIPQGPSTKGVAG